MDLVELHHEAPDGLSSRFLRSASDRADRLDVLIAEFSGTYPEGSLGNKHGAYIAAISVYGVAAFTPNALIVDLRSLEYRWGNALLSVFHSVSDLMDEPGEPKFPVVVVTSELCRDGVLSLVTPPGEPAPPWLFDEIEAAVEAATRLAQEWLDG